MCLAIPGRVATISVDGHFGFRLGKVNFGGIYKEVSLDFTPEARVGDYVLVHVGFALTVVDELEAIRVLDTLKQLGQLEELTDGTI